jgi:hypothetical protein
MRNKESIGIKIGKGHILWLSLVSLYYKYKLFLCGLSNSGSCYEYFIEICSAMLQKSRGEPSASASMAK